MIKPVCKKDWKRKNGTCLSFIQYCLNSTQRTLLDTKIAIPPEYWNKKLQRIFADLPAVYDDVKCLNAQLQKMVRVAEDILSFCLNNTKENPLQFLKNTFTPDFDVSMLEKRKAVSNNLDVYFQFDAYIESNRRKIAPSTVNIYMEVKKYLQALKNTVEGK